MKSKMPTDWVLMRFPRQIRKEDASQRRADFVREDFLLCHEGSVHASNSRIASLAVYAFIFRYSLSEENQ